MKEETLREVVTAEDAARLKLEIFISVLGVPLEEWQKHFLAELEKSYKSGRLHSQITLLRRV